MLNLLSPTQSSVWVSLKPYGPRIAIAVLPPYLFHTVKNEDYYSGFSDLCNSRVKSLKP